MFFQGILIRAIQILVNTVSEHYTKELLEVVWECIW